MFRPPEYAALINPISTNAFQMRCEGGDSNHKAHCFLCMMRPEKRRGPKDWWPAENKRHAKDRS